MGPAPFVVQLGKLHRPIRWKPLLIGSNGQHVIFRPPCESWPTNAASVKTGLNKPEAAGCLSSN